MKRSIILGAIGFLLAIGSNSTTINISSVQAFVTSAFKPIAVAQSPRFHPDSPRSNIFRDYDWTTPLPRTGKVTIRRTIENLDAKQIFKSCPADSKLYAFAESTNYLIEICTKEHTLKVPKYYFGKAKHGSSSVTIINENEQEANQLIFKNNGYTYDIYRDGARPEKINAYLEVKQPDNKIYAEALLYLYEKTD